MIKRSLAVVALIGVDATNMKSKILHSDLSRMDKTFMESNATLTTTPLVTNENRPLDEKRSSDALYKEDQTDHLKTDPMGEWDKHYEDSWFEGEFNTGVDNSPTINPWHKLPYAWEDFGPVN